MAGYETGSDCGAGVHVLSAVLDGRGFVHQGSDSLGSYILCDGWKCGIEGVGFQRRWQPPTRSSAAVRSGIVAINCEDPGGNGCPASYPGEDPI